MLTVLGQSVLGGRPGLQRKPLEGRGQLAGVEIGRDQAERMAGPGGQGTDATGDVTGDMVEHDTLARVGSPNHRHDQRTTCQLWQQLVEFQERRQNYLGEVFCYQVRDKTLEVQNRKLSLSGLNIPKVAVPRFESWSEIVRWLGLENFPGEFPYTSGVFPFKRENGVCCTPSKRIGTIFAPALSAIIPGPS